MPVPTSSSSSLPVPDTPTLELSWSSLGPTSSKTAGASYTAHSAIKRNRHFVVAQPSADKVCILVDGVRLVKVLPFWSSYHAEDGLETRGASVECVCVAGKADTAEVFVAAAAEDCVVVWSASSNIASGKERWHFHSRISVGQGRISCLGMQRDMLLIGSEHCVTLWALSSDSRQVWRRRWRLRTPKKVLQCLFSPDETSFAILLENDCRVRIWNLPRDLSHSKPEASCSLVHSRVVQHVSWRREPEDAGPTSAIITRTSDGVARLWTSVIDEPSSMRVWSTIDPSAMNAVFTGTTQACYYLDAFSMYTILRSGLQWLQRDLQMAELGVGASEADQERILDLKRSRAKRLEHLITETPDMFALLQSDGTLIIQALANVDRKPPTLCQSFVVLKMASELLIDPSTIFDISAHPLAAAASSDCYSATGILCVSLKSGEVFKYRISPSLLFDGLGDGLSRLTRNCDAETIISLQSNQSRSISGGKLAIATQSKDQTWSVAIQDIRSSFLSSAAEDIFDLAEPFVGLAWSPRNSSCPSMLAVASMQAVYILCPQRVSYVDRLRLPTQKTKRRWTVIAKLDVTTLGALTISGIVWQSDNTLAVAASSLVLGYNGTVQSEDYSGSHLVILATREAGSLSDDDPEVILQCLQWNKLEASLEIFTNIAAAIDNRISTEQLQVKSISWDQIEILCAKWTSQKLQINRSEVLDDGDEADKEEEDPLTRLSQLLDLLRGDQLMHFSAIRQSQLADLLDTTLILQRQSTFLDAEALRFVASVRHIATLRDKEALALDYKSFVWAYHSKTQERLIQHMDVFYNGKMDWILARRCGIFLWLRSQDDLVIRAGQVARQQFSGQDERDPTACSLLYYAMGKRKLVANLWRQAFWHKDQKKMLSFLNNDFTQARWQTAAFKNAFALLSQRRFEMAASFFLLGGGLRDAVNVCTRNLNDISLGIAIARLYEGGTKGPVFTDLLRKDVLQEAVMTDNRWLANWALSVLGEDDQALQVLCQPMHTLRFSSSLSRPSEPLPTHEDAELAMLFSQQLGLRPLPEELPNGIESELVLHAHRTLCADGLDGLGLAVLRTHKLKAVRLNETAASEPPSQTQESKSSEVTISAQATLHGGAAKVKKASLIQAAKPDSSKQAEMTFDVNSFNF